MKPDFGLWLGHLITAWATGKNVKIMVDGEWRDMTPDNLKAKAGDEWVTLREAIRRYDEREERVG